MVFRIAMQNNLLLTDSSGKYVQIIYKITFWNTSYILECFPCQCIWTNCSFPPDWSSIRGTTGIESFLPISSLSSLPLDTWRRHLLMSTHSPTAHIIRGWVFYLNIGNFFNMQRNGLKTYIRLHNEHLGLNI